MRTRLLICTLFAGFLTSPAVASEDGVYESLRKIPIGRIFLTAQERSNLDKIRGKEPIQPNDWRPVNEAPEAAPEIDPAGFIVSDSGNTRIWKNGDFVVTSSASDVRFPGEVHIASQSVPQQGDDAVESDEKLEGSAGAGDEEE